MGTISRGVKNAFRNNIRSFSIIFILAVSISMALIMLMALKTVQQKIDSVKGSIGNYITVSPAGIRGFEGGGELLTDADVANIGSVLHVSKVISTISDRLNPGTDTNLQSAIDAGSFGNRQRQRQQAPASGGSSNTSRTFTMPVMAVATSDLSATASLSVSQFNIESGTKFDENSSANVALAGKDLATKNNLNVGSSFAAYGQTVSVVGIFDSGNNFTNSSLVMPIKTVQTLSGQTGQVNSVIVQADSFDSVSQVQTDLKSKLGTKADVVSQQDSSQAALAPLQNIKTISLYSLIGSLVAGAIIIFLTMVMIVRERRREIGVLKAIGASNMLVMAQFTIESMVLTTIGSIAGMILGMFLSNPILKVLVNNSQASSQASNQGAQGASRSIVRFGAGIGGGARNALSDLHTTVGWQIIGYGLAAAIIIAIIGSAIPAFLIAKVRPAEVLRSE